MQKIAVIDYGMGNLRSVFQALEVVAEGRATITVGHEREAVEEADRVVFPGQGAIRDCMAQLDQHDLRDTVRHAITQKPFLGICIGQQALLQSSEEHAGTDGLAVLAGGVQRFPAGQRDPASGELLKIPHMGWNQVWHKRDHPLWHGIEDGARFYFVHSYYVAPQDPDVVAGETDYCVRFASAVARDRLFAVQFHPEKSQRSGLQLLRNFLDWDGS